MFSGIVQGMAKVAHIVPHAEDQFIRLTLAFPQGALEKVNQGASIAINGACLTVSDFNLEDSSASFDVIDESLSKTNLGSLTSGDLVNYERAAKFGDEIGGHMMSGHIHTHIPLLEIRHTSANFEYVFALPETYKDYLLPKGFVGINGCSLTLGRVGQDSFSVHLIPETLTVTNLSCLQVGDAINLEIDSQTQAIVDTVKSYMKRNPLNEKKEAK